MLSDPDPPKNVPWSRHRQWKIWKESSSARRGWQLSMYSRHITERDQTLGEARHFRNHNYKDPGKLKNRPSTTDLEEKHQQHETRTRSTNNRQCINDILKWGLTRPNIFPVIVFLRRVCDALWESTSHNPKLAWHSSKRALMSSEECSFDPREPWGKERRPDEMWCMFWSTTGVHTL